MIRIPLTIRLFIFSLWEKTVREKDSFCQGLKIGNLLLFLRRKVMKNNNPGKKILILHLLWEKVLFLPVFSPLQ